MIPGTRQLTAVGSIVKAFGVKGDIVVRPLTDAAERFHALRRVWLGSVNDPASEVHIERVSVEKRGVRLKLKGVDRRTEAEKLRGKILFVEDAERLPLPEGRYFVHDVMGLRVRDETGADLGTVADVLRLPAQDVYLVRGPRGDIMVPAVKQFVRAVDMENRTMTVRLIEGMTG
jgi:16S rRNA processing protein RimM